MSKHSTSQTSEPRLLSPREVAAHFGVQGTTILAWFHQGKIPARVAVGRIYRFDLAEVEQALADDAARISEKNRDRWIEPTHRACII